MARPPMARPDEILPHELKPRLAAGELLVLLDVREPWEYALAHLPGTMLIPMGDLPTRLEELDPDEETIVICHHGIRSRQVVEWLKPLGFKMMKNLVGGLDAWSLQVDPSLPRYKAAV